MAPSGYNCVNLFGLAQISEFKASSCKFEVEPALEMLPGAPICMPDMEFMNVNLMY